VSAPERDGFLDSSVIVRYLTNDPPAMAAAAARLVEGDRTLIVSELILAECAYVLGHVYGVPRPAVVDALGAFVRRRNIRMHTLSKPLALAALALCRDSGPVSFADALLWAQAHESGVRRVYRLDTRFPGEGIEVAQEA
jgi:predicted nucleic acid-binding protein